jgi:hypothetical protein
LKTLTTTCEVRCPCFRCLDDPSQGITAAALIYGALYLAIRADRGIRRAWKGTDR